MRKVNFVLLALLMPVVACDDESTGHDEASVTSLESSVDFELVAASCERFMRSWTAPLDDNRELRTLESVLMGAWLHGYFSGRDNAIAPTDAQMISNLMALAEVHCIENPDAQIHELYDFIQENYQQLVDQ